MSRSRNDTKERGRFEEVRCRGKFRLRRKDENPCEPWKRKSQWLPLFIWKAELTTSRRKKSESLPYQHKFVNKHLYVLMCLSVIKYAFRSETAFAVLAWWIISLCVSKGYAAINCMVHTPRGLLWIFNFWLLRPHHKFLKRVRKSCEAQNSSLSSVLSSCVW